jgi:hypothetical protein
VREVRRERVKRIDRQRERERGKQRDREKIWHLYSSSVGKLDQAGRPASACTALYRQKGKINPGDTGSQPKQLHIREDIKTTIKHLPVLDPMVFLYIF